MAESPVVRPDLTRRGRLGFDEAIYCAGKTVEHIEEIVAGAAGSGDTLLLTRLTPAQWQSLSASRRESLDYDPVSGTAYLGAVEIPRGPPRIAVVSAGTSDVGVGREAMRTLAYYGEPVLEVYDVGVAGLWRLLEREAELRELPVVIVAAGMDAALPSVLGGLIPSVVIAVPTSVGYGVAEGGRTALQAVLASCAPGVLVVNIDNGFGAACAALRVVRAMAAPDPRSDRP